MPTDNLKFERKITEVSDLNNFKFYLAGVRHYVGCEDRNCEKNMLKQYSQEEVKFIQDKGNEFDEDAIRVEHRGKTIGYVPRYYKDVINKALDEEIEMHCQLIDVNLCKDCDSCVEVQIQCNHH